MIAHFHEGIYETRLAEALLLFQIRLKFSSSFSGHEELDKHCFLHTLEEEVKEEEKPRPQEHRFLSWKKWEWSIFMKWQSKAKCITCWASSGETSISSKVLRNNTSECPKIAGECYTCWRLYITVFRRWAVQTNTKHPKSCIILVTLLLSSTVRLRAPHASFEMRWRKTGELWLQKLWVVRLYFSLHGRDICLKMFLE